MQAELGVALIGAGAGGLITLVAGVVVWWLTSRTELKKIQLQLDAQAHQTRYPDLARAARDFAAEMRRQDKLQLEHEAEGGVRIADDPNYLQYGEVERDEPAAEACLLTLEFFADDALRRAASNWLEAFYVAWYDTAPKSPSADSRGAFELLQDAERAYVEQVRRSLKATRVTAAAADD